LAFFGELFGACPCTLVLISIYLVLDSGAVKRGFAIKNICKRTQLLAIGQEHDGAAEIRARASCIGLVRSYVVFIKSGAPALLDRNSRGRTKTTWK